MANKFLRTVGTGFGVAALVAAATAIHAQDTNTVGNPQLKDFNLPGTRTTPPVTTQPAPVTPPVIEPLPPVPTPTDTPAASRPAPAPSEPRATRQAPETRQQPARREPAPATSAPPPTQAPAPTPEATLPTPAPVGTEQALPAPTAVPESQAAPAPAPAEAPAATVSEPQRGLPWLPIGIAALLALIGLTALLLYKRSRAASTVNAAEVETPQAPLPGEPDPLLAAMAAKRKAAATPAAAPTTKPVSTRPPAPTPAPAPAAAPAASPALAAGTEPRGDIVGVSMRPRLEIEFKPDRAAATLTETSVQFELTIRNVGNRTARDVRIQIHMDNPGPEQDRELDAFFAQAAPQDVAPAVAAIAPGAQAQIRTGITLPKARVRELIIEGRQLFVPVVAINVFYEWENGRTGQTSMSYIVGREAPTPQEKLGAFRLDQGPRLYRSVGQRQGSLAKVI